MLPLDSDMSYETGIRFVKTAAPLAISHIEPPERERSRCSIWVTNRNEPLKATAASTLSRLLRYNPGLLTFLLDKYGIRHLVAGKWPSGRRVS